MEELLRYVDPQGPLPDVKGEGALLVIGSACCVWTDLSNYDESHGDQDRMAINDACNYYSGPLKYAATVHPDKIPGFSFFQYYEGARKGWPPVQWHSLNPWEGVMHPWPLHRFGGTSGLFGVLVGLLMGYERIILAGIPCDGRPRFFDPPWQNHSFFGDDNAIEEWARAKQGSKLFADRVRSLSGRTRELLGAP